MEGTPGQSINSNQQQQYAPQQFGDQQFTQQQQFAPAQQQFAQPQQYPSYPAPSGYPQQAQQGASYSPVPMVLFLVGIVLFVCGFGWLGFFCFLAGFSLLFDIFYIFFFDNF